MDKLVGCFLNIRNYVHLSNTMFELNEALFTIDFQRSIGFSIPRLKNSCCFVVKKSLSQFWRAGLLWKEIPRRLLNSDRKRWNLMEDEENWVAVKKFTTEQLNSRLWFLWYPLPYLGQPQICIKNNIEKFLLLYQITFYRFKFQ